MRRYYLKHPEKFALYRRISREQKNESRRIRYANDLEFREKLKAKSREFNKRHPERKRRIRLKTEYEMTPADYSAMLMDQGGGCAICGSRECQGDTTNGGKKKSASLHVDHCHVTGMIRGILCSACNSSIGLMRDSPELLRKAADYLERKP